MTSVSEAVVAAPDDGQLGDPVALHELDGGADLLVRLADDEVGRSAIVGVLEREHLVDRRQRAATLEQAVLEHPVVVEELREVAAAAVGDRGEDRLAEPWRRASSIANTDVPAEPPPRMPSRVRGGGR